MNNIGFVTIVGKVARDLINIAVEKHLVIGYKSRSHVNQYVISGFEYNLDYIASNDTPSTVNLKDYKYIVFDYDENIGIQYVHVKLIKDDPTQDIYDLLMKIDELLADKQDLIERVNNLREDLFDRDSYVKKLKRDLEWEKTKFESMRDVYFSTRNELGELKKKIKGDN